MLALMLIATVLLLCGLLFITPSFVLVADAPIALLVQATLKDAVGAVGIIGRNATGDRRHADDTRGQQWRRAGQHGGPGGIMRGGQPWSS